MNEKLAPTVDERRWLVLALAATLPLAISCGFDRHLAMDGVNFFVQVLERSGFFIPAPARFIASVIQELPLVLAVKAGVTSIPVLKAIYGLGVLLPYWLGLAAAWRALPAGSKHFMALPIWSLLMLHYAVDGHLTHEGHVMAALAWAPLFFLVRREPWDRIDVVLLFLVLGALAFSYETAVVPELAFVALAGWRAWKATESRTRNLALIAGGFASLGVGAALAGILFPVDSGNRENFIHSLLEPWWWPLQWTSGVAFVCFVLAWIRGSRSRMLVLAALGAAVGLCWLTGFAVPSRGWVYPARTMFLSVTSAMLLLGAFLLASGKAMPRGGFSAVAAMAFALSVALFMRLDAWRDYRAVIERVVHTRSGLINATETPLWRHERRTTINPSDAGFLWDSWNVPLLSLVWSWPRAQALILNPPGTPWEPFDLRRERLLLRHLSYDLALEVQPAPIGEAKEGPSPQLQ